MHLSPILWTKDLAATTRFYESILGFKSRSNFPNFVALTKEDTEIMFVVPRPEPDDRDKPDAAKDVFATPTLTGSLYFFTDEVDTLWEEVRHKARVKSELADREYLMRDFSILDNNGYELVFGVDISGTSK
jgi:catechol 2,3-dioxygenase-like lactoylglutathione lyase family enzyme